VGSISDIGDANYCRPSSLTITHLTAAVTVLAAAICEADRRLVGTDGTSIGQ